MSTATKTTKRERQYARVQTTLPVAVRPVDPAQAEELAASIEEGASVWAPTDEAALRALAAGGGTSAESRLSRALLEVCERMTLLEARLTGQERDEQRGTILELSGGGGMLETTKPVGEATHLELRLEPAGDGTPPIRALVLTIGCREGCSIRQGFRFLGIHPSDHERLIRMIYGIQRRALRNRNG